MDEREIGRLQEAVDTLKYEVSALRSDISDLKDLVAQGRGGYKALAWVGGLAAMLLGYLGGQLSKVFNGPPGGP